MEKQRKDEEEREMLMKAAKVETIYVESLLCMMNEH